MKANSNHTSDKRHHKVNVKGSDNQTVEVILSRREKKVFDLLCTGERSVTDMTIATGFSDPRGYVRNLRDKGITVADYWVYANETRFKRYFIKQ